MKFSIIIPANNEEKNIGACLNSIKKAASFFPSEIEIIVVLNRCTDKTAQLAEAQGAIVVRDERRNLAMIRNTGAKRATGEILLTIDADSRMSDNTLGEIARNLQSGTVVGGGVLIRPERSSIGILTTFLVLRVILWCTGLGAGLFWCFRKDFEAIGGFNERITVGEDVDFARRLKIYGRGKKLKFVSLSKAFIVTSCRKFDRFGDWFAFNPFLFNLRDILRGFHGQPSKFSDRYFYDFKR